MALGETAGEALDALETSFPEIGSESLLVVQRFQPDAFFSAAQQQRLGELMVRWREVQAQGASLPPSDQSELESLIDAEVLASGRRAEAASGTFR